LVECLIEEREVVALIPRARSMLWDLKQLRNEGTDFALQMARPLRGLDDHIK